MHNFHPQDRITIVGALAVYDLWRDRDDAHAEQIYAM